MWLRFESVVESQDTSDSAESWALTLNGHLSSSVIKIFKGHRGLLQIPDWWSAIKLLHRLSNMFELTQATGAASAGVPGQRNSDPHAHE